MRNDKECDVDCNVSSEERQKQQERRNHVRERGRERWNEEEGEAEKRKERSRSGIGARAREEAANARERECRLQCGEAKWNRIGICGSQARPQSIEEAVNSNAEDKREEKDSVPQQKENEHEAFLKPKSMFRPKIIGLRRFAISATKVLTILFVGTEHNTQILLVPSVIANSRIKDSHSVFRNSADYALKEEIPFESSIGQRNDQNENKTAKRDNTTTKDGKAE